MGSRQRPSGHTMSDTGGRQARPGESNARKRAVDAEEQRHEAEMLSAARDDVEEALPSEEPAGRPPEER
jgi:hypothetical protein